MIRTIRNWLKKLLLRITAKRRIEVCPYCLHEIDPTCCWCGSSLAGHRYSADHGFIPIGCTCGYHEAEKMRGTVRGLFRIAFSIRHK